MIEREYNIPLRREFLKTARTRRAKRAVKAVRDFISKHMKSNDVHIGVFLNEFIWQNGSRSPPSMVKVHAKKMDDGKVFVELFDKPFPEPKKEEKKEKKAKKEEHKEEIKKEEVKTEEVQKEEPRKEEVQKEDPREKKHEDSAEMKVGPSTEPEHAEIRVKKEKIAKKSEHNTDTEKKEVFKKKPGVKKTAEEK